jgi:ribonuclease BN (tRNA processing enzyme)
VREHAKSGSAYQGEHLSFKCIVLSSSIAQDSTTPVLGKRPRSEADALPKRPVLAYLCETAGVQGKFLLDKAKALNIPPGPCYGKLKAGQTVELPDGRTIRPGAS